MTTVLAPRLPSVVDDVTVRLIAGAVLAVGVIALATQQWWLYAVLGADFVLRATLGPRCSPLALLVGRWVRPRVRIAPRPTAFAPKRFAAAIGAAMTGAITALWLVGLATGAAGIGAAMVVVAVVMVVFPALEALFGLCVGCKLFGLLGRIGLVDEALCIDCVRPSRPERVRVRA